jgi:hypothetical protein
VVIFVEDGQIRVNSRRCAKFADPEEYPGVKTINPSSEILTLDLVLRIKGVFPAIYTDETRFMLMCVL